MIQIEMLYNYHSITITAVLFLSIIVFNEISFRLGFFVQSHTGNEIKALTGSIQGSVLGLLALLLGFTFSMSIQRYDHRSIAVIEEANAIETALLRIELLPNEYKLEARKLFKDYIDLRVSIGEFDLTRKDERKIYNEKINFIQKELWSLAVLATNDDPRPVTTGAFVQSLNDVIDIQGKRNAFLQMHIPEAVLFLLFIVFMASAGIMGYSAGLSGKRMIIPIILTSFLISLIVFIIIDLDRPRRGIIKIKQEAMNILKIKNSLDVTHVQSD